MSQVRHITKDEDFDNLLKECGSKLVIVDFFATWCGPCKMVAPKFEDLSTKYPACFVKVDVEELEKTCQKYNVSAMPTFLAFKNGQKVDEVVGASIEKVEEMVKKHQ